MPQERFSRGGGATRVSPFFEHACPQHHPSHGKLCENFRRHEDAVDADVPVDAKNAPTRDLETTEQFPQRQQRSSFSRKKNEELTDKNISTQLSTKSDQIHEPSGGAFVAEVLAQRLLSCSVTFADSTWGLYRGVSPIPEGDSKGARDATLRSFSRRRHERKPNAAWLTFGLD